MSIVIERIVRYKICHGGCSFQMAEKPCRNFSCENRRKTLTRGGFSGIIVTCWTWIAGAFQKGCTRVALG